MVFCYIFIAFQDISFVGNDDESSVTVHQVVLTGSNKLYVQNQMNYRTCNICH